MFYKVSNTASKDDIQKKFNVVFKHPDLYASNLVVNGLGEDNLYIVTSQDSSQVNMAIWGLMPNNYDDSWTTFQNVTNVLNISYDMIDKSEWIHRSLENQRCLIIVTGFFTYFLQNGHIYPYYVSLKSEEPFYLAGLFTELRDGFLSTGIIMTKANKLISKFHNLDSYMPLAIPESIAREWLSMDMEVQYIKEIIKTPPKMQFKAHPIAREFFEKNIVYESILQPVHYEDIPEEE